jgi:hypothetical protein
LTWPVTVSPRTVVNVLFYVQLAIVFGS